MFKCLVVGSRSITDYKLIKKHLDYILQNKKDIEIVSGGASGVDGLAKQYATENHLKYKEFPADWEKYGNAAGYRRNLRMHEYISQFPDRICVAFWDGKSRGTKHSFDIAPIYENHLIIIKK